MSATAAMLRHYAQQADRDARAEARKPQTYGGPGLVDLRCFIRYHKDATQDFELGGKMRSLTHKQVAMMGLAARVATGDGHTTVTSMARECHVAPSTVSRFLLKLQCWNAYAVDVTRGRNGGVVIRLRTIGDHLGQYAYRAWERIKLAAQKALSRTKLNVASSIPGRERGSLTTTTVLDATFTEGTDVWRPCYLLDCAGHTDKAASLSFTARDADAAEARHADFARRTIAEIRRLAAGEPDWDVQLDKIRASYGLDELG